MKKKGGMKKIIQEILLNSKLLDEKRNDFFSRKISYFTHHSETTGWHTLGYTHSAPDRERTFKEEWLDK